jgi:hypothetical protein
MRREPWAVWIAIAAGCAGGGEDPVSGRTLAIVGSASGADVDELGVDADGCRDAARAGGTGVPVDGRPDLVGVLVEGVVVCVTTTEAAAGVDLEMGSLFDVVDTSTPMSEPEPEPYVAEDETSDEEESSGEDTEPEPEPYGGGDTGGSDDDAPDSQ